MAQLIDGKALAGQLRARIAHQVIRLRDDHDLTPGLAVVLVGEDPASQVYVRNKARQAREAGMASFEHRLSAAQHPHRRLPATGTGQCRLRPRYPGPGAGSTP